MPKLTCNGITIPVEFQAFAEAEEFAGDQLERTASAQLEGNWVARKRRWTARTPPQLPNIAKAMRALLEGQGQSWNFDVTTYSGLGEGPAAGGSYTQSGAGGKYGGKVNVASANLIQWALANALGVPGGWTPTQGWTLGLWKVLTVGDGGDGATFHHHVATGSVAVTRAASANPAGVTQYKNGVAGSWSMGNWISVQTANVGIYGYTNANAGAAYDYDDVFFLPFALPATWMPSLYTFLAANPYPSCPRVKIYGDGIEDPSPGVDCIVRVPRSVQRRQVQAGVAYTNMRELELDIREV